MLSITATDFHRFMNCNGSHFMPEPEFESMGDTTVRDEGNAAHWLVEQVRAGKFAADELIDRKAPNGVFIEPEMVEYLEGYLSDINDYEIEQTLNSKGHVWEIRARCDRVKYDAAAQHLYIEDLKYGWSIVEAKMNWTLIAHAMGWVSINKTLPFKHISFTIHQPRAYHPEGRVRTWTVDFDQASALFTQALEKLNKPESQLQTGEHCKNCKNMAQCPAALKAQYRSIEASHEVFSDTIDNAELSDQLMLLKRAEAMLKQRRKAYEELAVDRMKHGQIVPEFTTDVELANRTFKKDVTADFVKMMTGIDITEQKLMTPAAAERAGVSKDFVKTLTERRTKGVKLVQMSADKKAKKLMTVNN